MRGLLSAAVTCVAARSTLDASFCGGDHAPALAPPHSDQLAGDDFKVAAAFSRVGCLDRRIAQIDSAVEKATDRGRTAVAMKLADEQRKARADLASQRIKEAKTLADLKVEKAHH